MTNRKIESLSGHISTSTQSNENTELLVLNSPSDIGVRRNLGKNGARFAPKAVINALKKLNKHGDVTHINFIKVSDQRDEVQNFHKAQLQSSKNIAKALKNNQNKLSIHIGGGHDHVFPYLLAIEESSTFDKIIIINFDAHCDTRVDDKTHSGTPFRDFDKVCKTPTTLIQYGLNNFANSTSTLSELENISDEKIFFPELVKRTNYFSKDDNELLLKIKNLLTSNSALLISLDCDAISASDFSAVSAPNPTGIPFNHLHQSIIELSKLECKKTFLGIYELNPVFDNISSVCSKKIAALIYSLI